MATSTRASKNDQRTTLLFVLSLTVGGKKKKKVVSNKAFKLQTLCHGTGTLHIKHTGVCVMALQMSQNSPAASEMRSEGGFF